MKISTRYGDLNPVQTYVDRSFDSNNHSTCTSKIFSSTDIYDRTQHACKPLSKFKIVRVQMSEMWKLVPDIVTDNHLVSVGQLFEQFKSEFVQRQRHRCLISSVQEESQRRIVYVNDERCCDLQSAERNISVLGTASQTHDGTSPCTFSIVW